MSVTKRIVCLANSRKLSGRCIAGKELAGERIAGWVRPISARPHEEVSEHERQYEDGNDPRVMDIIDVPLLSARPNSYQTENWLLDPNFYWEKQGRATWNQLAQLAGPVGPLWTNGSSTYHGAHDRIELGTATTLTSSLRLVHVDRLTLSVFAPGQAFGNPKRRVQARFQHDNTSYRFWVTDPIYERQYLAMPNDDYELAESFLTVSIGEPADDGYCYKLIAAIIERAKEAQT